MRIGRLEFGIIQGGSDWSIDKGACGCLILSLGRLYFTWLSKDCICGACKQYKCICLDDEESDCL